MKKEAENPAVEKDNEKTERKENGRTRMTGVADISAPTMDDAYVYIPNEYYWSLKRALFNMEQALQELNEFNNKYFII
jgi:hypothetical protein